MIPSIHTIREMFHRKSQDPTYDHAAQLAALNKAALDVEAKFKISLADFSRQTLSPAQIERSQDLAKQFNLTQPAPQEINMASFTSILSDIGNGLKKFFGVAVSVATAAEPFVDQLFPGVATLYNTILSEVAKAEAAAVAAGAQNGTGAQKLALVIQAVAAAFPQYTPAQLTIIINGVVAGLNAIPASTATATPAS